MYVGGCRRMIRSRRKMGDARVGERLNYEPVTLARYTNYEYCRYLNKLRSPARQIVGWIFQTTLVYTCLCMLTKFICSNTPMMIFNKHGNGSSRLAFQELNENPINPFFHSLSLSFISSFSNAYTSGGREEGGIENRVIRIAYYLPRIDSRPSAPPPQSRYNMDIFDSRPTTSLSHHFAARLCRLWPSVTAAPTACKFVATVGKWWVIRVKFKLSVIFFEINERLPTFLFPFFEG